MSFPQIWNVGYNTLTLDNTIHPDEVMMDPRGFVCMWEPPMPNAKYIMSLDPTFGINNWARETRVDGDHKIDNAAFQILRVNAGANIVYNPLTEEPKIDKATGRPEFVLYDLQVAEYHGPIDPIQAARLCMVLGAMYKGDADDHAELIYESFPGPGVLVTQELLRLNYTNIWEWEYIADNVAESTGRLGWRSSAQSQTLLWTRAKRHMMTNRLKINSPWLLGEIRDAQLDPIKMRAVAASGAHDDLIQAVSMGMWAAHKWAYDVDHTPPPAQPDAHVDWQRRAPGLDDEYDRPKDQWKSLVDSWG